MSRVMSEGGDLLRLRSRLKSWTGAGDDPSHLILINLSGLGMKSEDEAEFETSLNEVYERFCQRRGASVYHITPTDTGVLVKLTEYNELEVTSELKVDIIRVIQQEFSEYFGKIDQSRLVRTLNLQGRVQQVIKFLETYDDRAKESGIRHDGTRLLNVGDIQVVRDFKRRMGRKVFAETFVRSQSAALMAPGRPPVPVMSEYYISVDMIRENVLKGVEFKGAGNAFTQLTRSLDQMVIESLEVVNPGSAKCSINLNVETIFTHAFQNVLEGGNKVLANVAVEIRLDNIFANWGQFKKACDLIKSHGGTVAVDGLAVDQLGLVDLPKLDAKLAKVFWGPDALEMLPSLKNQIRDLQERGTVLVLARVDDELGVRTGQACGFTMFQGFYVDNLLAGAAAAAG